MDKKEAQNFIGTTHHFHPEKNPAVKRSSSPLAVRRSMSPITIGRAPLLPMLGLSGSPTKPKPIVQRQNSASNETPPGSPVGSPVSGSPLAEAVAQ